MQDKAIAAIGKWQLETELKGLEPVDLYIENMFPNKDYQMLLLVFEIYDDGDTKKCCYKGIDIEKVSAEKNDFRKYAYRKGSARGGDVTLTTKISSPVSKKINGLKITTFKDILNFKTTYYDEKFRLKLLSDSFSKNESAITNEIDQKFKNFSKEEVVSTGLSFKIVESGVETYLRDYEIIKLILIDSGAYMNYEHAGTSSKSKNKISSVSGINAEDIYGFAAPFKYSSPDKPGFISGFFNKKLNWRNYPIASDETLELELGRKFAKQHLTGYFYGYEYMVVPHPFLKTDENILAKIINLLQTAFQNEKNSNKETKKRAEDRIQKIIANEENYFNLDLLFFTEDKKKEAISIHLMLEEIMPSRFRTLFIDVPALIQKKELFKNAIFTKKDGLSDLNFSFQLVKDFFEDNLLDNVNKIFVGKKISFDYVLEHIISLIRKNYNKQKTSDGYVENTELTVKKAIMLISYLQELNIISHNKNYKYMEPEIPVKEKETTFMTDVFNDFVKTNSNFLDSDIKVGIFSVGVLTRFLFDIQSGSLSNTPFEKKLRGYKLNAELLLNVYTEALNKIQQYQNFYVYTDLREIINTHFVLKSNELKKMSNNEVSFYFVAGLEMGKKFKRPKQESENK